MPKAHNVDLGPKPSAGFVPHLVGEISAMQVRLIDSVFATTQDVRSQITERAIWLLNGADEATQASFRIVRGLVNTIDTLAKDSIAIEHQAVSSVARMLSGAAMEANGVAHRTLQTVMTNGVANEMNASAN